MARPSILEALTAGRVAVLDGLPPAGLAYLLAREEIHREQPLLVVTPTDERAVEIAADLRAFGVRDLYLLPAESHVPFAAAAPDVRITFAQQVLRQRLIDGERPQVIVTPAATLQARWCPEADFVAASQTWRPGDERSRDRLAAQLIKCGYNRVSFVEDPGTFAVRGSIVDVYPPSRARPVRIDLFGDDIAWIKSFDADTQRTYDEEPQITVHPLREVIFTDASVARAQQRLHQLAEVVDVPTRKMHELAEEIGERNYLYGIEALWPLFYAGGEPLAAALLAGGAALVLDDARRIDESLAEREEIAERERERVLERNALALAAAELVEPAAAVRAHLLGHPRIEALVLADDRADAPLGFALQRWDTLAMELELRRKDTSRGEILDPVVGELRRLQGKRCELFLTCSSRGAAERLRELLLGRDIDLPLLPELPSPHSFGQPRRHPRVAIAIAALTGGFRDVDANVAMLTEVELFGTSPRRGRRRRKRPPKEGLSTLRDLRAEDLVIHIDHGIGRYLGLKRLVTDGIDGDYVHLEYAGGDKLYVPIYRLNSLQRYGGPKEGKLDKLGGTRWEKTKQRVKDAVLAVAHNLLAVQARRALQPGYALAPPDDHFRAFEARFIHEETEDQQRAIRDVIADLQKGTPMDRLVCGDVGFGKTEVAIRAAFLAVLSGKQVAVLVPTTVLAEQHGLSFLERLESEAVVVDVLSRFRSTKQIHEITDRLAQGQIDILIGTHRLLSHDVVFDNLGLLIVDEEQRFGVRHKERIKELRSQVHVLTLSATPIPRTMHMAMVGLRDLSIIQTPPAERTAIRTEVTLFDEELVREVIRRELHRGGQVFFVHNRVQSIDQMADLTRELVPEARIAVAHGQMRGTDLERIMVDFVRREYDILVSTAIIESGIDIPSANTMIINRADIFGLAQLHQLRGRIGRGRERAYAYFLLPRSAKISKEATERLGVLKRFSDLGSGFQIASQDLDIRGAGDLLGAEQSGNMMAVGVELYTELLADAVETAKGQRIRDDVEPEIKLTVSAVLPEVYIQNPMLRLEYYQRLANAESDAQVFDICSEIEEVFGEAPDEVHNLGEVMVIRRRLKALGATTLAGAVKDDQIKIGVGFLPDAPLDRIGLAARMQAEPERYRLLPSGRLAIQVPTLPDVEPIQFLRRVRDELGRLEISG